MFPDTIAFPTVMSVWVLLVISCPLPSSHATWGGTSRFGMDPTKQGIDSVEVSNGLFVSSRMVVSPHVLGTEQR